MPCLKMFTTVFTGANHCSLFRTRLIKPTISYILKTPFLLQIPHNNGPLSFWFSKKTTHFSFPFARATCYAHRIRLQLVALITSGNQQLTKHPINFLRPPATFSLLHQNILDIVYKTSSIHTCIYFSVIHQVLHPYNNPSKYYLKLISTRTSPLLCKRKYTNRSFI